MSCPNTVNVKNIASATSDKEIKDFFSFCGKITDIQVTSEGESKAAVVTFEKDTAAKTALLLNNTQLGANHISVTGTAKPEEPSAAVASEKSSATTATSGTAAEQHISQEEKPRARIFAEYLAHGYVIGDAALERAIDLDHKHNVSQRFVSKLTELDQKYHATEKAKAADQSYGVSTRANTLLTGLGSYFEKASATPNGKRLVDFYTLHQKKAQDIHNEARRLAEIKKQEAGGSAYKAAGLEKIFGAEKKVAPAAATGAAPAATATTTSAAAPEAAAVPAAATTPAATAAATTTTSAAPTTSATTTETPKFDAPPTKPTA